MLSKLSESIILHILALNKHKLSQFWMSRAQRSVDAMGANIWTAPKAFGVALGVCGNNVVAYSSEYRRADPLRFASDEAYESTVEIEASVHIDDPIDDGNPMTGKMPLDQGELSLRRKDFHVTVRHRHRVSDVDPDHHAIVSNSPFHKYGQIRPQSTAVHIQKFRIYAGAKFQCVEYARRYLIMTHHISFPSIQMAYHILLSMRMFLRLEFTHTSVSQDAVRHQHEISANTFHESAVKSINPFLSPNEKMELIASFAENNRNEDAWLEGHHVPVPGSLLIWAPHGFFKYTGQ
jgi:hypothetical protein